jgi:hypothetical protein
MPNKMLYCLVSTKSFKDCNNITRADVTLTKANGFNSNGFTHQTSFVLNVTHQSVNNVFITALSGRSSRIGTAMLVLHTACSRPDTSLICAMWLIVTWKLIEAGQWTADLQ